MKIYIQDNYWEGIIIVIAACQAEAREMMKSYKNYNPEREIIEREIVHGFRFAHYGDC